MTVPSFSGQKPDGSHFKWDPKQYLSFQNLRLRPAIDLLQQIPLDTPKRVVDLGCGTGNVTRILQSRWPQAQVTGIDSSKEMLKTAQTDSPAGIRWQQKNVAQWKPQGKLDLIFSNATLHWLDDHDKLFPKLMSYLKPGGILAVQMPGNFWAPSHTLIKEAALAGPWKKKLEPLLKTTPVLDPKQYYDILAPHSKNLNIWETQYLQILDGKNPVAEWTKGTWLKPFLDALDEPERSQFEAVYRQKILNAYPPGADGKTRFPFRRLFIIAQAKA